MSAILDGDVSSQPFLLVEDDSNDVYLLRLALPSAGLQNPLFVVGNGDDAISYLSGTGGFSDRKMCPLPAILLLDLNLPGKDGFEILEWLSGQRIRSEMFVVVLTNSARKSDITRAQALKVDFFLTKPTSFDDLVEMARCLHYLLRLNRGQRAAATLPTATSGVALREEAFRVDVTALPTLHP